MENTQHYIRKVGLRNVDTNSTSQKQSVAGEQIGCENCLRLKEINKELLEALKDIKEYVINLDAMGPETSQVIAAKCYLAIQKAENDR